MAHPRDAMTDFLSKLYDLLVTNWKRPPIGVIALITSFLSDGRDTFARTTRPAERLRNRIWPVLLGLFAKDAGKKGINENDAFCSLLRAFLGSAQGGPLLGPASEIPIPQRESRILGVCRFYHGRNC